MEQPEHRPGPVPIQGEWNSLGKPQVFVQLAFGISWSDRHIPRSHNFSYTSKSLKSARESGHFPRQVPLPPPPSTTAFLTASEARYQYWRQHFAQRQQHQHRGEQHHHDDHEHPRGRAGSSRPRHVGAQSPSRGPRSDLPPGRRSTHERGSSAPPPIHDSPWSDEGGPSATLFPRPARAARNAPHLWKDLPTDPAQFRLGEDGLPWSAWAWPFDPDGEEDEPPFANLPTTVPLSPPNRRRSEDPQVVKDLQSLSTAMMTVDNGFDNQWWNQGEREAISWCRPEPGEDEDVRPMSVADAVLLSAAEPPSAVSALETYTPSNESLRDLVSPLSDTSPTFSFPGPLQRSFTTRSDELWMGR